MKFRAITNDKREIDVNWDAVNQYVKRWAPGTPLDFEITRRVKKVSPPMRRYYFSTVLPTFLDAYYYDRDESEIVHTHLKCLYFQIKPDKHGIYRAKDIPSVFSDEPTIDPHDRVKFTEWVIRKCAQSPDNPKIVPIPNER